MQTRARMHASQGTTDRLVHHTLRQHNRQRHSHSHSRRRRHSLLSRDPNPISGRASLRLSAPQRKPRLAQLQQQQQPQPSAARLPQTAREREREREMQTSVTAAAHSQSKKRKKKAGLELWRQPHASPSHARDASLSLADCMSVDDYVVCFCMQVS